MKITGVIVICLFLISCLNKNSSYESERLHIKLIQTPDITVDWFFYSYIGNNSPDYVVITRGTIYDTVCRANNIADINVIGSNKLTLAFYGHPELYGANIELKIPKYIDTVIDTTYQLVQPVGKESFRR
jgi:hypothetical protein